MVTVGCNLSIRRQRQDDPYKFEASLEVGLCLKRKNKTKKQAFCYKEKYHVSNSGLHLFLQKKGTNYNFILNEAQNNFRIYSSTMSHLQIPCSYSDTGWRLSSTGIDRKHSHVYLYVLVDLNIELKKKTYSLPMSMFV